VDRIRLLSILILFITQLAATAQEIKVEGQFLEDSFKIGEKVHYSLKAVYPKQRQIIFVDSLYTFDPFEYLGKSYFETRQEGEMAIDSVVFELTAFEIDPFLLLELPIFVLTTKDSIKITAAPDTIYTKTLIPVMSDTLQVKTNTDFVKVPTRINYPYLAIGAGVALLIAVLVYFLFGGNIRRKLKLRRLRKSYEKFVAEFDMNVEDLIKKSNVAATENVLGLWKKYLEKLENQPYTKLTTKELLSSGIEPKMKNVLQAIDRNIYSGKASLNVQKSFDALKEFTAERYQRKVEEIKNG
jgi:hypothetical protein